ncbi:tyrosine--tRNA ligase [Reyranella sp.]|jgi:tyrosyl-tRNA synthetase|uniref:tyrosine--tRNA ligase n=1 Tax=Reyranella sp. TaxID=1929291 RepID=UPI000BD9E739|nr:tyrosine--tRNA ligase [Reyranella sp.]OYY35633.1 MAG: tyrosine--tRNA ligase [Rhodospirillales bacterium 35-66-84]OYZ91503.1 MAG: tyrosine--tRNA ligase [Rhodospirillales bacterium 24-66-33]OZB22040.1 MAG: tyrosine--tRNA ligase [Rhodospirillales bacterium 39-66-50]HQS14938.1 tyrosine--tRNA ligase [Reyranella sp.]HQT10747.1 tyrosine--tRNA ligase [Reyranella sp.]
MADFKSDFMRIVHERGMVHQCSDTARLDELLSSGVRTAYIGFDCTADSLHVGHLLQVMLLRWWQKSGHKPIALMGGGTTKVGDPSGRDETRQLLTTAQIDANMASIKKSFANYLTFGEGTTDAVMANNADWLDGLLYIPLLRDVGRHFSVNRMLTMDSVKLRLERDQPLSFLEFNYMILQSYDFVELNKRHDCIVQMGGSDQWGNIVMGADLGRRMQGAELFALTSPLLATASGAKMGKTAAGAVWLNPDRLSPYDFWQYWRNTEDADVGRFLKLFTDLPLSEVARLEALQGQEINEAKKILATEVTTLAHGRQAAESAAETARRTFEEGSKADTLPTVQLPLARLKAGIAAFELMHEAGLADSKNEARKLIKGGGGRLNDKPIANDSVMVTEADLGSDGTLKLSAGRKRHVLVRAA